MASAHPEAPATWFRLSEESWAQIREAYRNGATARELAARWRVSPGSVYRHACAGGWTKKRSADAAARAHAAAIAEEEAADEAGLTRAPPEPVEPTPSAMAERALRDMSRALAAGRYGEAQALGKLVETLGRLGAMAGDDGQEDDDRFAPLTMDEAEAARFLNSRLAELKGEILWPRLRAFAEQMLEDTVNPPVVFSRAFLRWRAEHLGPEVAETDRRQARPGSAHYDTLYDEDGKVRDGWDALTWGRTPPPGAEAETAVIAAARLLLLEDAEEG